MRFRTLRIAWSVFWGLACVLLVVLWVRSYQCVTMFSFKHASAWLGHGELALNSFTAKGLSVAQGLNTYTFQARDAWNLHRQWKFFGIYGSHATKDIHFVVFKIPVFVVVFATLACIPWLAPLVQLRRYSLRTLLIATTVVAVAVGLAVWAAS